MWTVVYIARSDEGAKALKEALEAVGILVKIRNIDKQDKGSAGCYEIMVPEAEVAEAHNIIIETGF